MDKVIDQLKKNKPSLSLSSLKTYNYILRRLMKKLEMKTEDFQQLINKQDEILEILADESVQVRKTILAVLVSLFGQEKTEKLRKKMLDDANTYNEKLKSQNKTEKQEKNWMSWEEVMGRHKSLSKELSPLLKKDNPSPKDLLRLVDLILLSVFVLIPPRRSQDYTELKLRSYDVNEDNYFDPKRKAFVFNKYKTKKTYGQQIVHLPTNLLKLINRWSKINPHDHLLFDSKGGPLSPSRLTIKLNNIFGKNISSSMLRHIYISEKVLADAPKIREREKVAEAMGHSINTQEYYNVE